MDYAGFQADYGAAERISAKIVIGVTFDPKLRFRSPS